MAGRPLKPQATDDFAPEAQDSVSALLEHLEERGARDIEGLLAGMPPADVAAALDETDEELAAAVFRLLEAETGAEVLREVAPATVRHLADEAPEALRHAAQVMAPDDVADLLEALPEQQKSALLSAFSADDASAAERLLTYAPDTAGGLMTTEFVLLAGDITCHDAIEITQRSREAETVADLFVEDRNGRLVGHLPLQNLVFARPHRLVRELMEEHPHMVTPDTDQEDLVRLATRYNLDAVPVVDEQERLVGVVTVDDILEAAEQEADEDMYRLAGTGERDPVHASIARSARMRMPWLLLSVMDGLLIAVILSHFELADRKLLYFLPLIPLMGGQVAIQASTIMVRGIAVGSLRRSMIRPFLIKQFFITLVLSLCCAAAAGVLGHLATDAGTTTMMAVGIGVLVAVLIAGMLGMTLPLAFNAVGIDPALSAGPFITMLNDLICIFIYIMLGTLFVP